MTNKDYYYNEFECLMRQLPDPENPVWTKDKRDKWLTAMSKTLDLITVVDDDKEEE